MIETVRARGQVKAEVPKGLENVNEALDLLSMPSTTGGGIQWQRRHGAKRPSIRERRVSPPCACTQACFCGSQEARAGERALWVGRSRARMGSRDGGSDCDQEDVWTLGLQRGATLSSLSTSQALDSGHPKTPCLCTPLTSEIIILIAGSLQASPAGSLHPSPTCFLLLMLSLAQCQIS